LCALSDSNSGKGAKIGCMTVFFTPGRKTTIGGSIDSHREEKCG